MMLIRSLAYNVWFILLTSILAPGGMIAAALGWRPALVYGRFWARLLLGGLRVLCGVRVEVSGAENLPDGPALIASMHQSAFDTLVWFGLVPGVSYVVKRELARIPIFGRVFAMSGMIVVDRDGGAASIRALQKDARQAVADRRQIVIFPEGTRTDPGSPIVLQPGIAAIARQTGLPVIPVATDSGICWGRRSFRKSPGIIHIVILPPLAAGLRREELLIQLRQALEAGAAAIAAVDKSVGQPSTGLPDHARLIQ